MEILVGCSWTRCLFSYYCLVERANSNRTFGDAVQEMQLHLQYVPRRVQKNIEYYFSCFSIFKYDRHKSVLIFEFLRDD